MHHNGRRVHWDLLTCKFAALRIDVAHFVNLILQKGPTSQQYTACALLDSLSLHKGKQGHVRNRGERNKRDKPECSRVPRALLVGSRYFCACPLFAQCNFSLMVGASQFVMPPVLRATRGRVTKQEMRTLRDRKRLLLFVIQTGIAELVV